MSKYWYTGTQIMGMLLYITNSYAYNCELITRLLRIRNICCKVRIHYNRVYNIQRNVNEIINYMRHYLFDILFTALLKTIFVHCPGEPNLRIIDRARDSENVKTIIFPHVDENKRWKATNSPIKSV